MEKGGGGGPATRAAGGICDRFLTFLGRNLTMSRAKSIAEGPRNGGHPSTETEGGEEEDEFAIPIERAEFDDYEFGGRSVATTVLEESTATTTTTTTMDVPAEPKVAAAAGDGPAAAVETTTNTKVRKTVTIKEDHRPEEDGGAASRAKLERKKSLFKKRQASSAAAEAGAGGEEQEQQAPPPRRSGLRPRMPPALRVPSNIDERSSTFIEQRRRSFGRGGKPAPDK